jgi:serine O-acetyltransferase
MSFSEYRYLLRSDLYRYEGSEGLRSFLRRFVVVPEFRYNFWMRTAAYLSQHPVLKFGPSQLARLVLRHYTLGNCVYLSWQMRVGSGFFIGHFGQIFVDRHTVIGKNCNISQGVGIVSPSRGPRKGCATIGDNVYIAPGAQIIGNVTIGNNVAIGSNCVVTKDVPDNAVVVGVPGKVISYKGSTGYVNWTDYR